MSKSAIIANLIKVPLRSRIDVRHRSGLQVLCLVKDFGGMGICPFFFGKTFLLSGEVDCSSLI
jgi:hypothetical protein